MNMLPSHINAAAANLPQTYEAQAEGGFVYAATFGEGGLVKIGFSRNPDRRVCEVSAFVGVPCRLLALAPATMQQEAEIHRSLAHARLFGEWFRHDDVRVRELVQSMRDARYDEPLPGFEHLKAGYEVERDGAKVIVPLAALTDADLSARAKEYEEMAKGCRRHAYEIREFVRSRSEQQGAA